MITTVHYENLCEIIRLIVMLLQKINHPPKTQPRRVQHAKMRPVPVGVNGDHGLSAQKHVTTDLKVVVEYAVNCPVKVYQRNYCLVTRLRVQVG